MNSTYHLDESIASKAVKILAYSILSLVSLVGNVFILMAIRRDKRLRTTTNKLIANMAVSDLMVPLFSIQEELMNIYVFSGWKITGDVGQALCKLLHFFQDTSIVVSVYSCVFIAIDRYYAVAHPLKRGFSSTRLKLIIIGIWILAVVAATPSLVKYQVIYVGNRVYCHDNWTYVGLDNMRSTRVQMFTMFTILNGIPIPTIIILYTLIVLKMKHYQVPGETSHAAATRRVQRNKKVLKLSIVVVSLLFLSWLFLDMILFLGLLGKLDSLPFTSIMNLVFAAKFIAFSSSAYNFFVYLGLCDQYRWNFKILFSKCCFCCSGKCGHATVSHSGSSGIGSGSGAGGMNMDTVETR